MSVSVVDSFVHELDRGDTVVINSELWSVLEVRRDLQVGMTHVYTDHDVLILPNSAIVEIALT